MHKIMKNTILLVLLVALVMVPVSAESESSININKFKSSITITALDIQLAKSEEEIKYQEWKRANRQRRKEGANDYETDMNARYNPDYAKMEYDYFIFKTKKTTNETITNAEKSFYKYIVNNEKLVAYNNKIERLENELKDINTKIELGLETVLTSNEKESEIAIVKTERLEVKVENELIALELNKFLLWPLETTIDIIPIKVRNLSYEVDNIDKAVKDAKDTNGEFEKLEKELKLKNTQKKIIEDLKDDSYGSQLLDTKREIAILENKVANENLNNEYIVRSTYNSYLGKLETVEAKKLELRNLEYKEEIVDKRYDLKMETKNSLEKSKEEVLFKQIELEEAIIEAYIEAQNFKNLYKY